MNNNEGQLVQLQNFSINDGEGIRTTIFLMGCPLRCNWCSNPETWTLESKHFESIIKEYQCPNNHYSTRLIEDEDYSCPICQETLEYKEIRISKEMGITMSVEQVINKIRRQEIFYRHSNGGVTFSGGEPTFQQDFLRSLVYQLDDLGIDLAIETSGYFIYKDIKDILEKFSHIFYDLKCMDDLLHQKMCGVSNTLILDNLIKLKELNIPITIRIPSIKEVNFNKVNLNQTLNFIKNNFKDYPINIEFLPCHTYGEDKYEALGINKEQFKFSAPSIEEIDKIKELFEVNGIKTIEYK